MTFIINLLQNPWRVVGWALTALILLIMGLVGLKVSADIISQMWAKNTENAGAKDAGVEGEKGVTDGLAELWGSYAAHLSEHPLLTLFITAIAIASVVSYYKRKETHSWVLVVIAASVAIVVALMMGLLGEKTEVVLENLQTGAQKKVVVWSEGFKTSIDAPQGAANDQPVIKTTELPEELLPAEDGSVTLVEEKWSVFTIPSRTKCISYDPPEGTEDLRVDNKYKIRSLRGSRTVQVRILKKGETFMDYTCK